MDVQLNLVRHICTTLSQASKLLFGDEEVIFNMPMSMIRTEKTFVPVESKYRGYSVSIKGRRIIVNTIHDLWRKIFGWSCLYRFVGRLPDLGQAGDTVLVPGIVTMRPFAKIFLSIWFCFALIGTTIFLGLFILTACMVLFSNAEPIASLVAIGIMLGGSTLVVSGGIAVLAVMRLLSSGQRRRLTAFLRSSRCA